MSEVLRASVVSSSCDARSCCCMQQQQLPLDLRRKVFTASAALQADKNRALSSSSGCGRPPWPNTDYEPLLETVFGTFPIRLVVYTSTENDSNDTKGASWPVP
ncbi:Serine/threonine-protein kinase PLK4 [Frankliniella fusca]|uniref:Serine/threonine-protein kinase PLK4 n=1 Tax=Frankliniella fusca TaxID=407009 RepID=A0AAE1I236_9NEOP|nr:Serine/threonine-protein kinase PLK4 [Frankliniella fusca]